MPANVKTPKGRVVHRATRTWEEVPLPGQLPAGGRFHRTYRLRAAVVCNRVPIWHAFTEVNDRPVDCPGCLIYIKRNGNECGLPYVSMVVKT